MFAWIGSGALRPERGGNICNLVVTRVTVGSPGLWAVALVAITIVAVRIVQPCQQQVAFERCIS